MTHLTAVWCGGGQNLLAQVHNIPILRLTMTRAKTAQALIPWTSELDHLQYEVKSWNKNVIRCHPDERIAMRDLMCVHFVAGIGVLVQGHCGTVDYAEILMGVERVRGGVSEHYASPRIKVYKREDWLRASDTEDWVGPLELEDMRRLLPPTNMEGRTAEIRARAVP